MKLEDAVLTVFSTTAAPMDASDVLTALEERTGKEYRLASVFNCMLDLSRDGRLAVANTEGKRTLYQLPMTHTPNPERAAAVLLPCPFCGPGESVVDLWHDDVSHRWRVGCGRCGCSTGIHPRDKSQTPAVEAWNRRASPPAEALPSRTSAVVTTEMVDAAMLEVRNLHPPMRRSDCERLLRAALSAREDRP